MSKSFAAIIILLLAMLAGCSKKTTPTRTTQETPVSITTPDTTTIVSDTIAVAMVKTDTVAAVKKAPIKRKVKEPVPKVISVNDAAAKKSVDGRFYYDLQGHRYWRNNKDGKYYLYNKSMNSDPDFKKPQ